MVSPSGKTGDRFVYEIIREFNEIQAEIRVNNEIFWSQFSFIFLIFFMTFQNSIMFSVIYSKTTITPRIFLLYPLSSTTVVIISYLTIVSSVSEAAFKCFKPLNKLLLSMKANSNVCKYKVCLLLPNCSQLIYHMLFKYVLVHGTDWECWPKSCGIYFRFPIYVHVF